MTGGRTNSSPNVIQQKWMAILINSTGYLSTQWSRLLDDQRMEEVQEITRLQEDELDNEGEIEEIMKQIVTRNTARNKDLICGILMNGGCTKVGMSWPGTFMRSTRIAGRSM